MKKFILAIAFIFNLVMPYASFAQNQASFHLTEHGIYVDEQSNDFIVIPFEGQSAQQIYKRPFQSHEYRRRCICKNSCFF